VLARDSHSMRHMLKAAARIAIESIHPQIDGGRFPVKRTVGENLHVEADVFADGHDALGCRLLCRSLREKEYRVLPMTPIGNDRWAADLTLNQLGRFVYTIEAWIDPLATWIARAQPADRPIGIELLRLAREACTGARDRSVIGDALQRLKQEDQPFSEIFHPNNIAVIRRWGPREHVTRLTVELPLWIDPERARFSTWYELFPRSASREPDRHGTFRDVAAQLPRLASLGFDVLYLPPIHPIGVSKRKGKIGSPWAIGSNEGGHTSIHPELGTLEDFRTLVAAARERNVAIALDLAFQCSPDHPWVQDHPEWFVHRADGTIACAENPPKRYEDVYPLNFEKDAEGLYRELAGVVEFWIRQGVEVFRVDNPHTKPFAFWEWLLARVKEEHPQVIFLSEAFTRPKVKYRLGKLGFSQGYTYFTWKNTKAELTDYFGELSRNTIGEFFRPNVWPNTPDILHAYLQLGGRPAFVIRLILAAMLSPSYGIYGPAYELCEQRAREPGSEEYLDSEKFQIRRWDLSRAAEMEELILRLNRLRRAHPALQHFHDLQFHETGNSFVICFSKASPLDGSRITVAVNLDPQRAHSGWIDLSSIMGKEDSQLFEVRELLRDQPRLWQTPRAEIRLDPAEIPAVVLQVVQRARTERDFDYYL
jgi:starch synthase (maltosyl-transferring)